jgi:putative membrane protein
MKIFSLINFSANLLGNSLPLTLFYHHANLLNMHSGRNYTILEFLYWTRRRIYLLVLLAVLPTVIYATTGCAWILLPWPPIVLIGTATAFIAGFRNNATYGRAWEARQIWGRIVNSSRAFGIMAIDFIRHPQENTLKAIHQRIVYRHLAWITALRHQLREKRQWENSRICPEYIEYQKLYSVPEWSSSMVEDMKEFLPEEEWESVKSKKNIATQIMALQSADLRQLAEQGMITELKYVELQYLIKELYDHQGGSERIKNFPYPRQYSSLSRFFIAILIVLIPLGMLNEFAKLGSYFIWLSIPFSILVSWVFITLDVVGESTENPFEGAANDVPISTISRVIEIDLKEMLGLEQIPAARVPKNFIQM